MTPAERARDILAITHAALGVIFWLLLVLVISVPLLIAVFSH